MKRSLFSLSLYREGLRQTRLISIPSLVLMELMTILPIIGKIIILKEQAAETISRSTISYPDCLQIFRLCFCVVAPLMTLYLFSFLNKRSTSDFYHALPYTRPALYLSYGAAALTNTVGIFLITAFSSFGLHSLLTRYFVVEPSGFWSMLLTGTAAIILVIGAVLLAMSLTGNVLSNIIVTGLILFLPRTLLLLFRLFVLDNIPLLPSRFYPFPFGSYNLVFGMLESLFTGEYDQIWSSSLYGIYTLCLGLLYLLLGLWAFCRRKSEAAGQNAPSRLLQTIYRLCIGFAVSIIPTLMLVSYRIDRKAVNSRNGFILFVLYLVAVLVYFLYELITTRKFKNLLKAMPALGILVLLNVAAYGIGVGVEHTVSGKTPTAGEIASVQFYERRADSEDYFSVKQEAVQYEDAALREMLSAALNRDVQAFKKGTYYRAAYPEDGFYLKDSVSELTTRSVRLNLTDGTTLYRIIRTEPAENKILDTVRANNEVQNRICWDIPDEKDFYTMNLWRLGAYSFGSTSGQIARELYVSLLQERQSYPSEKWTRYILSSEGLDTLEAFLRIDGRDVRLRLPIGDEYPETARKYRQYANRDFRESGFMQAWRTDHNATVYSFYASWTDPETSQYREIALNFNADDISTKRQELNALFEWLSSDEAVQLSGGETCLAVQVNLYGETPSFKGILYLPQSVAERLLYSLQGSELSDAPATRQADFDFS